MPINVRSYGDTTSSIKGVRSFGDQPQPTEQEGPETFGQQAKRTAAATGIKGVGNAQGLLGLAKSGLLGLGSLFGMEEPHARLQREGKLSPEQAQIPDFAKLLQEKSGYSQEQLQPKNAAENFVQRFGSQAPFSGLLGGVPGLISTGVGSTVASGAGSLGAPEGIQDLLQLGTEIGAPFAIRNIPQVKKALKAGEVPEQISKYLGKQPTIKEAQKTAYGKAGKLGGEDSSIIKPIEDSISSIEQKLTKITDEDVVKKVNFALEKVDANLNKLNSNIKVKDALELRRNLGKTYNKASTDAKPFINELRNSFNDFFAVYGAKNPAYLKALNHADRLTEFKNMKTYLDQLITKLRLDKLPGGELTTDVINFAVKGLEKGTRGIAFNSAARKYLTKAVLAGAKDNPALFMKNIENLNSLRSDQ